MMPGRRQSDDFIGLLTAAGSVLLMLLMAWGTLIFFAASSWAFFVHVLRMWGAA